MTVEDAINILELNSICSPKATEFKKAVEIAKNALDKQIPKKPDKRNPICYRRTKDGREMYAYDHYCPSCDKRVNFEGHHCPCGQALDWSDFE